jgi:hypothetical protein
LLVWDTDIGADEERLGGFRLAFSTGRLRIYRKK